MEFGVHLLGIACLSFFPSQDEGSKRAAEWVDKLRSDRIEERVEAMQRLRDLGKTALPVLEKAAHDADVELTARATRLREVIAVDLSVTPALRKIRWDIADRIIAKEGAVCAKVLLEAANREKHPEILKEDLEPLALLAFRGARVEQTPASRSEQRLWHEGYGEGGAVARAIVNFDLRFALPAIQERLAGKDYLATTLALETIAHLRAKEAAPALVPLLRDSHSAIMDCRGCRTAEILRELDANGLVPPVEELLMDDQPSARIHAVEALSLLAPDRAVAPAIKLLKDPKPDVREYMLRTLGRLEAKKAIPDVEAMLKDSEIWVRSEAAETLALLDARESAPAIARLLSESEKRLRAQAIESLGKLGAKAFVPDIEKALDDAERMVREEAVHALARLEARECVPRLVQTLKGQDYWTRIAIVEALGKLRATREIPALFDLFRDTDRCKEWATCHWMSAGEALLDQDVAAVVREGARHLLDPNPLLRKRAFELFGRLDPKGALPEILRLIREGDPALRASLATLACRLGSQEGVPFLLEAAAVGKADLGVLNALRRPTAWKRLSREVPLTISLGIDAKSGREDRVSQPTFRGTPEHFWKQVGRMAELPVTLPPRETKKETEPDATLEISNHQSWTTLADILRESLSSYDFILEDDRIRILSRPDALAFWREWVTEKK